jgi:hypothetical protein
MDGHVHVMTRQLLEKSDIGQRYPDGHVDLPRAREGGVDAMFFSVYTRTLLPCAVRAEEHDARRQLASIRSRKLGCHRAGADSFEIERISRRAR